MRNLKKKIYKELNDDSGIAMNYNDIGNLYYEHENYSNAKKYFQDALTIYEKLKDKSGIASCYTNLGNAFSDDGKLLIGIDYYKQSIIKYISCISFFHLKFCKYWIN